MRSAKFILAWIALSLHIVDCGKTILHSDLFPLNDEYDSRVLDPNTLHGSPYGGFSRAIRSRLASIPLPVPSSSVEISNDDDFGIYLVRDGDGRVFICRVYDEDELEPDSLMVDSMFTSPKLSMPSDYFKDEQEVQQMEQSLPAQKTQRENSDSFFIESIMTNNLKGICLQRHYGGSFEFCFEDDVVMFDIDWGKDGKSQLRGTTVLGGMVDRQITTRPNLLKQRLGYRQENGPFFERQLVLETATITENPMTDRERDNYMRQFIENERELGIVKDIFRGGDQCKITNDTGNEEEVLRSAVVEYRCCSLDSVYSLKKRGVLLDGKLIQSNIAAIVNVEETKPCHHHMLVCTPLFCDGLAELYEDGPYNVTKPWGDELSSNNDNADKYPSIRKVLSDSMSDTCLSLTSSGWWSYEFCFGKNITQFHGEQQLIITGGVEIVTTISREMEFTLGFHDSAQLDKFPIKREVEYLVNATDSPLSTSEQGKREELYFMQEYTKGDVCENDETIKDKTGGIHRATTVRYFCGEQLQMRGVNEDSTCHYEIDITVPELCNHPLFKPRQVTKSAVKCIPNKL